MNRQPSDFDALVAQFCDYTRLNPTQRLKQHLLSTFEIGMSIVSATPPPVTRVVNDPALDLSISQRSFVYNAAALLLPNRTLQQLDAGEQLSYNWYRIKYNACGGFSQRVEDLPLLHYHPRWDDC